MLIVPCECKSLKNYFRNKNNKISAILLFVIKHKMNALNGILDDLNTANFEAVKNVLEARQQTNQTIANYFARINKAVLEYQEDRTLPDESFLENWESAKNDHKSEPKKSSERSSQKENIKPKETPPPPQDSPPKTRPRRNAFKEASENINQQVNASLSTKLRRPQNLPDCPLNVKLEKLSISGNEKPNPEQSQTQEIKVKTETEVMPAPTRSAPRKKKRKGQSKIQIKQEKSEEKTRDSDVLIQDVTVTVVNLVDSSDEGDRTMKNDNVEEKKSAKTKKVKRLRTYSSDEDKGGREKRSKSIEEQNEHVEAAEEHNEAINATYVAISAQQETKLDATVVVDNPKYVKNLIPTSVNDMMTDDESEEEVQKKSPRKPVRAIPKPTKQIFSPFEQSPVKKKVQAFEKLKEDASAIPPRITRTKTRAQAKEKDEGDVPEAADDQKSNVKEKAKIFTPTASKFLPKAASTTMKSSRVAPSTSNESLLSAKSASALKASQAEYREREKKRREKEQEALKKREALIQAQIEEKKRKREEKQLKAQQQREVLEKEKMKLLEAQRLKDERHKQLLADQEEKKQKQKEEMEKKRQLAKARAIEEKRKEEEKRLEEQKKGEEMTAKLAKQDEDIAKMLLKQKLKQLPIYMRTRTPELPTPDCYDSDDERYRDQNIILPDWLKEQNLKFMQKCAFAAGEAIKNTFFSIQAQTPDLQEIFEVIEPQKLKRSSSAMWHKPPRFTMMPPGLEDHDETDDFDDYDD